VARKGAKRRPRVEELRGERLSYGEPVTFGGRTVITVTRVRASGGGNGRAVEATPVGYIEMTADGSAYHPIDGPGRGLRVAATAATTVVGLLAGARALRASRRPVRLLPPGRR
jgi:hypothetical protein